MVHAEYTPPESAVIKRRQNETGALRLLIAQRRLYTRARAWQGVRWVGLLVLGLAAPFVALLAPGAAVTIGAIAGAWLFFGRTLLTVLEARTMVKAACVQEELDQMLFAMPITITRSERPEPEEVALQSGRDDRLQQVAEKEDLLDWYPIDPSDPGAISVAIAQRSNASYTGRLIRTTVIIWAAIAVLWVLILIIWAAATGISLSNFLLGALFPVLPAVLDVSEYLVSTWKAARDRADLAATIAARLSPSQPAIDGQELLVWQERLFDLRRTTPQIPDWLYRITRRRNERAMQSAAASLRSND